MQRQQYVFHVGPHGKEIIEYPDGTVSKPRLTKAESEEWKDKKYYRKQMEKYPEAQQYMRPVYGHEGLNWLEVYKYARANKLKAPQIVEYINKQIDTYNLFYRG